MKQSFDIGMTFTEGLRIWWKNLPSFVGMTFLVGLPVGIAFGILAVVFGFDMQWLTNPEQQQQMTEEELRDFLVTFMATFGVLALFLGVAVQVISIAVVLGTDAVMGGRRLEVMSILVQSMRHVPRVLLMMLMVSVPVVVGVMLCCLPGAFLFIVWYVALPAMVLEQLNPIEAMKRSWALTLPQFWYMVLLIVALFAANMVFGIVISIFGLIDPIIEMIGSFTSNLFLTSLAPVFQTVAFAHLRRNKEGDPGDAIAEVFE